MCRIFNGLALPRSEVFFVITAPGYRTPLNCLVWSRVNEWHAYCGRTIRGYFKGQTLTFSKRLYLSEDYRWLAIKNSEFSIFWLSNRNFWLFIFFGIRYKKTEESYSSGKNCWAKKKDLQARVGEGPCSVCLYHFHALFVPYLCCKRMSFCATKHSDCLGCLSFWSPLGIPLWMGWGHGRGQRCLFYPFIFRP